MSNQFIPGVSCVRVRNSLTNEVRILPVITTPALDKISDPRVHIVRNLVTDMTEFNIPSANLDILETYSILSKELNSSQLDKILFLANGFLPQSKNITHEVDYATSLTEVRSNGDTVTNIYMILKEGDRWIDLYGPSRDINDPYGISNSPTNQVINSLTPTLDIIDTTETEENVGSKLLTVGISFTGSTWNYIQPIVSSISNKTLNHVASSARDLNLLPSKRLQDSIKDSLESTPTYIRLGNRKIFTNPITRLVDNQYVTPAINITDPF